MYNFIKLTLFVLLKGGFLFKKLGMSVFYKRFMVPLKKGGQRSTKNDFVRLENTACMTVNGFNQY